ncbi:MAG: sel1 repeat family protein [Burkholderiales bacterium]|nr:sel1 repeat family protein [Burkholderiales bacterium]
MRNMKLSLTIACLTALILSACAQSYTLTPTSAEIESAGMLALHGKQSAAIKKLTFWAEHHMPTAQRELGLAYITMPDKLNAGIDWLNKAASAGDEEAQFQLAEAAYKGQLGFTQDYRQAWKWYEAAARQNNAKASFMLARMCKYGEGRAKNLNESIAWLKKSSEQGNAQAMFLLSNAYAAGEGVRQDASEARKWLELAAEGDFPVAIQALAIELQGQTSAGHDLRARHLIKEASDERLMRWNKYQ